MKKRKALALCLSMLLLVCSACGGGSSANMAAEDTAASSGAAVEYGNSGGTGMDMELYAPSAPQESQSTATAEGEGGGSSVYQNSGAKLIRRAELSIQTTQFDQTVQSLQDLVEQCGGYFEQSSVYAGSYRDVNAQRSGEYVVRIPAEKYDAFLSGSGDLGYVTQLTESSEDIGEQYYDTESRLKTQRIKQERLLELLEKAETMEDIIALENALSEVEYQIEQYTSTLNRYDALVGFSTFNIYLNEVSKVTEEVGETASLGARMAAGFRSSLEGLVNGSQQLLIWVSYNFVALAILIAAVAVGGIVGCRSWKKRRKIKEEPKNPE